MQCTASHHTDFNYEYLLHMEVINSRDAKAGIFRVQTDWFPGAGRGRQGSGQGWAVPQLLWQGCCHPGGNIPALCPTWSAQKPLVFFFFFHCHQPHFHHSWASLAVLQRWSPLSSSKQNAGPELCPVDIALAIPKWGPWTLQNWGIFPNFLHYSLFFLCHVGSSPSFQVLKAHSPMMVYLYRKLLIWVFFFLPCALFAFLTWEPCCLLPDKDTSCLKSITCILLQEFTFPCFPVLVFI